MRHSVSSASSSGQPRLFPTLLPLIALLLACAAWLAVPPPAAAQTTVDVYEFETEEQERRFQELSQEFRCPMCQNANLADSPGGVAGDLRREIYNMIVAGRSNEEIREFMHARYGDFIFYRPRLDLSTALLWFGPLLFLLIGAVVVFFIIRHNRDRGLVSEKSLSDEEQARLRTLLDERKNERQ